MKGGGLCEALSPPHQTHHMVCACLGASLRFLFSLLEPPRVRLPGSPDQGWQPNDLPTPAKGFHSLFLRKGEPPLSTYPVHNGSVHRVVYCPHSDMGVGNGTGTV